MITKRPRRRLTRALLALAVPIAVLAFMPGRASAAMMTVNPTFSGSGSNTSILSAIAVCDPCAPDVFFHDPSGVLQSWGIGASGLIQAQASWSNPSSIDLNYSAGKLRHGQTLDLTDTLTPGSGSITINYSASATLGIFGTPQSGMDETCAAAAVSNAGCNGWVPTTKTFTVGPVTASDTIPCQMPLPGESPRDCSHTKTINLWSADFLGIANASIDLVLDETVHVTGSGVATVRIAVISGGDAIPNNVLSFGGSSPSSVGDPISISCTQPVGSDLMYTLQSPSYSAEPATYSGDVKLAISGHVFGFIGGTYTTPPLISSSGADLGPIAMNAPDQNVDLGPVLANNVPPTANSGGPYSGNEGSPVSFDGSGSSSICGLSNTTMVWHFSDGGVAFGMHPTHTFHGPGNFTGELTVTDGDGNSASSDFTVSIANLPPVANAGPDMSTEWGVPVTLAGSAVDPGSDEQPFLSYSWSFGDGSPSASGGASATHTYAAPGVYTATFTACDPEAACGLSTMQVTVVQRTSTISYTGPTSANSSKTITLSATVVDDLGQAVVGKIVVFTLGAQTISAMTNGSGVASVPLKLNQKHGSYTVSAAFAGDSKYVGSSTSQTFTLGP